MEKNKKEYLEIQNRIQAIREGLGEIRNSYLRERDLLEEEVERLRKEAAQIFLRD